MLVKTERNPLDKKTTPLIPATNFLDYSALFLATGFGSGYSPFAPGTAGTIVAVPIYIFLTFYLQVTLIIYVSITLAFIVFGSLAAHRTGKHFGVIDAQQIVVDEIAGFLVTMSAIPLNWPNLILGFALFRVFDIFKPWPVSYFDRKVANGFGVVMDDVVAGCYALAILHFLRFMQIL